MKLYYFYGAMNSAKSLNLLAKAHQFKETGSKVLLMKPTRDDRDYGYIKTRAGLKKKCRLIGENVDMIKDLDICYAKYDYLLVDEAQFLSKEQVINLWQISRMGVRVFAYGLKNSSKNKLFKSTEQLLIMSDEFEEIKSKCNRCRNKATTHIKHGGTEEEFETGDVFSDDGYVVRYESVCQECYIKHHIDK